MGAFSLLSFVLLYTVYFLLIISDFAFSVLLPIQVSFVARMQKNGLERPAEEMIETSTFIRTPLTGTAADSKRAWLYSGKNL